MSAPSPSVTPPPAPLPASDGTRAVVTAALAVYLVGLVLAILGNGSGGASALVRTIKSRLYAPWLVPAWLDLGHDQHLTYGLPEDAAHGLELRVTGGDARSAMRLPGRLTGERAARWRRLAASIAPAADGDEAAVALAAAVAAGGFADLRTDDLTLRVLRRRLPERRAVPLPQGSDVVTSLRVRRVGGELQLIKADPPGEVAPLVRPRAAAEAAP